ncbi:MAG: 4-hydroxythreonine-4-phosphate dehydrogenase PdxA [Balneolaceae bacterium]|nr:4-hydroxythreonine-4-phosphate dehydrogenase PdxA [Balneolaceae bacterium]
MSVRIAISIGDIHGIGPEIVLKYVRDANLNEVTPIILGNAKVLNFYRINNKHDISFNEIESAHDVEEGVINLIEAYSNPASIEPGIISKKSGKYAMQAVEKGIDLCLSQQADALVTAPISKEAVNLAGYQIPGHTEFLAEKTDCSDFMMMLVHENLRVGLVTIHEPLASVPNLIDKNTLLYSLNLMNDSLKKDFQIESPKIAILGLNPHAGDGGYIGKEEIDIISPALEKAKENGINTLGPFSADAFFGGKTYEHFDAVLAMYHDQGLIPFKTISFGSGVNFTAGLPIIRTSPDHGTAFDIAGKNKADPSSFKEAMKLAQKLIENRKRSQSDAAQ